MVIFSEISKLFPNLHVNKGKGFILLDIVIGTVILSVALLAIMSLAKQATVASAFNNNYTRASYLAKQKMEEIKALDGKGDLVIPLPNPETVPVQLNPPYPSYIVNVTTPVSTGINSDLIPVQVQITWQEVSGKNSSTKTITLVGYYQK